MANAPATLRERIAEETITIRGLKDDLATAETNAEAAAIEAASANPKGLGGNDTERKAALKRAVADSAACTMITRDIRKHEANIVRLEAKLADQNDSDQRQRWLTRARLVEALDNLALAQPQRFFSGRDIDRTIDDLSGDIIMTSAARDALPTLVQVPVPARPASPKIDAYRAEAASRSQAQHDVDELFA